MQQSLIRQRLAKTNHKSPIVLLMVFLLMSIFGLLFVGYTNNVSAATTSSIATKKVDPATAEAKENLEAATIMFQKNITKLAPEQTPFYETLTRKNAALLIKRFAVNVLGKAPIRDSAVCNYSDIQTLAPTDKADIVMGCQIGVFKPSTNFNPNNSFSRGQLVIVIARLISGNPTMELTESYDYLLHLGIVKVDDRATSTKDALRKDVYIMLSRIVVNISQVVAFGQFTNMTVGNINTAGGSVIPTLTTDANQGQVFKVIAYNKDMLYGNYIALQMGSAVLVSPNKIVTNAHVVLDEDGDLADGFEICRTLTANTKPVCFTTATVDFYDEDADLALLTLGSSAGLPEPAKLATVAPLNGDEIRVRGYPNIGGVSITLTKGIISGVEREKYKSDVKIDHGNSGGGAYNKRGELIGIPNSASVDTDTMSYIIPYTVVKSFLEKQGNITTPPKLPVDASFTTYIKSLQTQTNANAINTPFFSIPSVLPMSFAAYNFDASRNLYSVALVSSDTSTLLGVSTAIANEPEESQTGPYVNTTSEEDEDFLATACANSDSGSKTLGNTEWEYVRCDKYAGGNESVRIYNTTATSGVTIDALIQSSSSSTKQADEAEKVLNTISVKKDAQPVAFDIYTAGPIVMPKLSNLYISYDMDEYGEIDLTAALNNSSSTVRINSSFDQYSDTLFNILAKGDPIKEFAGGMDSFYNNYYVSTLGGTTVKNANNNIFYLIGYKDTDEDAAEFGYTTRYLDVTTLVRYNNMYLKIEFSINYDGDQNPLIDNQIKEFLDKIVIKGDYALTDTASSLPSVTSIQFQK